MYIFFLNYDKVETHAKTFWTQFNLPLYSILFFLSFFFFLMWTIFKVLMEFLTMLFRFLCFGLLATWHVGFQLPDQGSNLLYTWNGKQCLNPWTTREVPSIQYFYFIQHIVFIMIQM